MQEQADWLKEMVRKVGIAVAMAPTADRTPERRGSAIPATDRGDDWFRVRCRVRAADLDRVDEALLAPRDGVDDESYGVLEAEVHDGTLYVRALVAGRTDGLFLYTKRPGTRRLRQALHDGLSAMQEGSPTDCFGRGLLDLLPSPPVIPPGYSAAQARALEACCAPGLQMVWGPPGTGKTHVISGAVIRLLEEGRRVLLVSSTNVAVDNAVQRVLAALSDQGRDLAAGEIVRVGTPDLHEVATDPRVSVTRLVYDRLAGTQARLEQLGESVRRLREDRDGAQRRLERAQAELSGFDVDAYRRATERRQQQHELEEAEGRAAEWRGIAREADAALAQARRRTLLARFDVARMLEHAKSAAVEEAEREVAAVATRRGLARLLVISRVKAVQTQSDRARWEKTEASRTRQELQALLGSAAVLREIPPVWTADFSEVDASARQELAAAEEKESVAARWLEESRRYADDAEAHVRDLQAAAGGGPSSDDLRLLEDAERKGLPSLQADLPVLADEAIRASKQHAEQATELQRRAEEAKRERAQAEQRIIAEARVVATTLAMSTVKKAVGLTPFDQVLVDEAAAAPLPEIVNAVGKARRGACLLGDYLQNGPIVDSDLESNRRAHADVYDLFATDCFHYFGLTDPVAANGARGCVVLTEQRRFGETVTDLANRVAYDGILVIADDGSDPQASPREQIVFVDVDGLGTALTTVRREGTYRGSWPVGALLARALGEHHVDQGQSVGVVTPYREQARTTAAFLDETDTGMRIDVGTSHAFQGREFDVVVFDMLENGENRNGHRLGWVGQGTRHRDNNWLLSGLRLFNVATTRARRRLYLIGTATALEVAPTGPLAHVRDLVESGAVQHIRARDLLGLAGSQRQVEGGIEHDLNVALSRYVRIVDIYDQDRVLDEVRRRIDGAQRSVWVWSPWVGRHATALQDALRAANDRGVEVYLVALPEEDVTQALRESLSALRDQLPHLVLQHRTHQKIVVVDECWAFLGSMNLLSHAGRPSARRQEVMVQVESRQFAEKLLWHERADDLRHPPRCPACHERMWHAYRRQKPRPGWYWFCGRFVNGTKCRHAEPFSDSRQPSARRGVLRA